MNAGRVHFFGVGLDSLDDLMGPIGVLRVVASGQALDDGIALRIALGAAWLLLGTSTVVERLTQIVRVVPSHRSSL
jgi:hypothetical protein